MGRNFDKKDNGEFDLHKEGGHSSSASCITDNTGAEIQDSLIEAVKQHPNITVFTNFFCGGNHHPTPFGHYRNPLYSGYQMLWRLRFEREYRRSGYIPFKMTIMATGGCEAVYRNTTNPLVATGDGIAMVYRAKGAVKDMRNYPIPSHRPFIIRRLPCFLITEAMRGYGGVLRTMDGKGIHAEVWTFACHSPCATSRRVPSTMR